MRPRGRGMAGLTLVELLVGTALGLAAAAALTALVRAGVAAAARAGAEAERAREVAAAVDQLARDVRVAGHDPRGAGIGALVLAAADRLELAADLDGDGAVDPDSEERVGWRVAAASRSLQRVVGAQTLPIATDVRDFALAYFDGAGAVLDPSDPATAGAARVVGVVVAAETPGGRTVRLEGGARVLNR